MTGNDEKDNELALRSNLYFFLGILVLFPNFLSVVVFNSSKDFRQRFVFFTMLSVSDMINGISFILSGMGRLSLLNTNRFHIPIDGLSCMTTFSWPVFLLLGGQLPATFHCLLTVERVLAVNRIGWYRSRWSWRNRLYLTLTGISICVFLTIIALLVSFVFPHQNQTQICSVMDSTGSIYGTVHYCWIAFSYLAAFIVTLSLYWKSRGSKFLAVSERRKQMAILILSGISVLMVSIPNVILVIDEWQGQSFSVLLVGVSYLLYGIQSCFNLPIFYFFRIEFRRRVHDIFRCRNSNQNTVMAQSIDGSRHQVSRMGISFAATK